MCALEDLIARNLRSQVFAVKTTISAETNELTSRACGRSLASSVAARLWCTTCAHYPIDRMDYALALE